MSDSVRPHRRQPTRLPRPWDSPGKNTGVGFHFLPQCRKVKSESKVAQECLALSNPMDCRLPGSSVHGISRQEYWSGLPLPSPHSNYLKKNSRIKNKGVSLGLSKGYHPPDFICIRVLWVLCHKRKLITTLFINPSSGRKQMVHSNWALRSWIKNLFIKVSPGLRKNIKAEHS